MIIAKTVNRHHCLIDYYCNTLWRWRESHWWYKNQKALSAIYFKLITSSSSDCATYSVNLFELLDFCTQMKICWFSYCLKKPIAMQFYFLFIPLYLVLNFLMKSSSLSFLTKGSILWTFSKIVTLISFVLCPGRLKWAPVAFDRCLFAT